MPVSNRKKEINKEPLIKFFSDDLFDEIGVDVNLNIPNLWFPFISLKGLLSKNSLPQTKISLGTSFQKNIGLAMFRLTTNH